MVTKINSIAIILFAIIGSSFISCKTLTVQEFKEKYDAIEVDGEVVDGTIKGDAMFNFFYLNNLYRFSFAHPPYLPNGRKYKILIDKENPDKHYLVLLYKPIPLDTFPIVEGQIFITKVYKSINETWVYYEIIGMGGNPQQGVMYSRDEFFEDVKYYDTIKKYKDENSRVVVDVFMVERISENKARVVFKINYQKTNELNNL